MAYQLYAKVRAWLRPTPNTDFLEMKVDPNPLSQASSEALVRDLDIVRWENRIALNHLMKPGGGA